MKAPHTPGPWYAIPNEHYVSIKVGTESHDQNVASVFLNEYIKPEVTMDVAMANAKLMSKAPELLEMLSELVRCYKRDGYLINADLEDAEELINKAF